jgi:hypothetical protein
VTTPLIVDELDEAADVVVAVVAVVVDASLELLPLDVPDAPDGRELPDAVGVGCDVLVAVGDGVGVEVFVGDAEGDAVGLPESLDSGSAVSADDDAVRAAYTVAASSPENPSLDASVVPDDALDVVVDESVESEELLEVVVSSLAAPPPSATEVVPLSESRVKSASTVWEIVPTVAFVVR